MNLLVVVLIAVVIAVVVAVVTAPLRSRSPAPDAAAPADPAAPGPAATRSGASAAEREAARAELEAEREAKYREIRDAELDFRTGKLSPQDYEGLDATLRAEAVEILRRLDAIPTR
jgi:hypothetical protein